MLFLLLHLSVLCSVLFSDLDDGGGLLQKGSSLLQIQTLHDRKLPSKSNFPLQQPQRGARLQSHLSDPLMMCMLHLTELRCKTLSQF